MDYDDKLKAAREAGKASAGRRGSIRADVAEVMARGESRPAEIWLQVLERRSALPACLMGMFQFDEIEDLEAALATWNAVRAAIKQCQPKDKPDG